MGYVNVGAIDRDGKRFKTKKAMKEAIESEFELGSRVGFDQTAMLHSAQVPEVCTLGDLPEGVILSVVGPDPYSDRRWYANVERKGDKVKVS